MGSFGLFTDDGNKAADYAAAQLTDAFENLDQLLGEVIEGFVQELNRIVDEAEEADQYTGMLDTEPRTIIALKYRRLIEKLPTEDDIIKKIGL